MNYKNCVSLTNIRFSIYKVASRLTKLHLGLQLSMGKFATNSSDTFSVYICETSLEDFNAYVDECIANGFDVDYSRYDQSYYAEDKDGADLTIIFEGNEIMYISIYDWSK